MFLGMSVLCSCDTDAEKEFYKTDKVEYAFAGTLQKMELLPEDGNKIVVPVYRNQTAGSSTVELSMTVSENAEGLFTLATPEVTFEDGKASAEAIISYENIDALGASDVYKFDLSFDAEMASPAQINSITVSAQRKLTFEQIGVGTFSSTFFTNEDGSPLMAEQVIEKAKEANTYRLPDVYAAGYPLLFSLDEKGNVVSFSDQETGYVHSSYGMVSVHCTGAEKVGNTYKFTLEFLVSAGSFGPFVESITFPEK